MAYPLGVTYHYNRIPFTVPNGLPGAALVLTLTLPDGRPLVICANEEEYEDAPVNEVVEDLFRTICQHYKLDPSRVVWVEYTSEVANGVGGWERVDWRGSPGVGPKWHQMTAADWGSLGIDPPPAPTDLSGLG